MAKISISMSDELEQKLDALAGARSRTVSGLIVDAILAYYFPQDGKPMPQPTAPPANNPPPAQTAPAPPAQTAPAPAASTASSTDPQYLLGLIRGLTEKVTYQGNKIDNIDLRLCKLWDQVNDRQI